MNYLVCIKNLVHVCPRHVGPSIHLRIRLRRTAVGPSFHLPYACSRDAAALLLALFESYSQSHSEWVYGFSDSFVGGQRFRKKRRVGSHSARSLKQDRDSNLTRKTILVVWTRHCKRPVDNCVCSYWNNPRYSAVSPSDTAVGVSFVCTTTDTQLILQRVLFVVPKTAEGLSGGARTVYVIAHGVQDSFFIIIPTHIASVSVWT